MVANILTEELINGGKNLLQELDASGIKVNAALWFYFPEEGFWKLMLSFPNVEKEGPKAAYVRVQKALFKLKGTQAPALDDITIARPNAPLVQLLKIAIRTGPGISGIRFSNNVINGQLIPDAYIYRLT
jgi:hypothetical protein